VGKPEGKRPLERARRMWMDNIKMDLKQDVLVWTGFIWLKWALENTVTDLPVT
jgi:hypothetical protein